MEKTVKRDLVIGVLVTIAYAIAGTMFGGQLVPLADVWYYLVGGFALLGFVLCGIGTATSIRKHLNV